MKFKCFCDLCVFQDKAPFIAKAGKLKEEYEKTMRAYNMGIVITSIFYVTVNFYCSYFTWIYINFLQI